MNKFKIKTTTKFMLALALPVGVYSQTVHSQPAQFTNLNDLPRELAANDLAVEFDPAFLTGAKVPRRVAELLKDGSRFLPGDSMVDIEVNGRPRVRQLVNFSPNGLPCLTQELLERVGFKPLNGHNAEVSCPQMQGWYANSVTSAYPNESLLVLTVPEEALRRDSEALSAEVGGRAALLNYRLQRIGSQGTRNSISQTFLDVEAGANIDDWVARGSTNFFSNKGGLTEGRSRTAFLQRTFPGLKQTLQVGRFITIDPISGGIGIDGAQWTPEASLQSRGKFSPIQGTVVERSRVEVRQQGVLIYSTFVPPGSFALGDFSIPSYTNDLEVKIIGESGQERDISIPTSTLLANGVGDRRDVGQYFSVGRAHSLDSSKHPELVSASYGWYVSREVSASVGALTSSRYQRTGGTIVWSPLSRAGLSANWISSHNSRSGESGSMIGIAGSISPLAEYSLGFSSSIRSKDFQEFGSAYSEAVTNSATALKRITSLVAATNQKSFGSLSLQLTRQTLHSNKSTSLVSMSYGRSIGQGSINISLSKQQLKNESDDGISASVTLDFPFGEKVSTQAFVRRSSDTNTNFLGVGVRYQSNESSTLQVTEERASSGRVFTSLSANIEPKYLSADIGLSNSGSQTTYSVQLSGGIATDGDGLSYSPQRVSDTFGFVRVGEVSGVPLDSPSGLSWTGPGGLAVIPFIPPYASARVDVRDRLLPDDIEVSNAQQTIVIGRGAVASMKVAAKKVNRVLLKIIKDGDPLKKGAVVLRDGDALVATVDSEGVAAFSDYDAQSNYQVVFLDDSVCLLTAAELQPRTNGVAFQRGVAKCK